MSNRLLVEQSGDIGFECLDRDTARAINPDRSNQGRTFGAPRLTAPTVNSEDGREQSRGKERPG